MITIFANLTGAVLLEDVEMKLFRLVNSILQAWKILGTFYKEAYQGKTWYLYGFMLHII